MKVTVLNMSNSGKSANVQIVEKVPGTPFANRVQGWMAVPDGEVLEKGESFDLPAGTIIEKEERESSYEAVNEETGEVQNITTTHNYFTLKFPTN